MIIANPLGEVADLVFATKFEDRSPEVAWIGLLCYAFQIYFDFSGYSDMAVGLGKMFAFTFMENFNYPYIADSITDFWRRWHISLSTWFRDYVYVPLGGNKFGLLITLRNLIIVFLLCGIWHGANWTFLFWGVWNGVFLVVERLMGERIKYIPKFIKHIYVSLVILVGWLFFRIDNLNSLLDYLGNLFICSGGCNKLMEYKIFSPQIFITLLAAAIGSTPIPKIIFQNLKTRSQISFYCNFAFQTFKFISLFFILFYSISLIVSDTYNPFIYFRF